MNYNVAEILKECLHDFGRKDLVSQSLDNHSTITIDMKEYPSINITHQENGILLWSEIADYNPSTISFRSENLLSCQMKVAYEEFSIGQPALHHVDDKLELYAYLQPHCLTSKEHFGAALTHFFEHMKTILEIIK